MLQKKQLFCQLVLSIWRLKHPANPCSGTPSHVLRQRYMGRQRMQQGKSNRSLVLAFMLSICTVAGFHMGEDMYLLSSSSTHVILTEDIKVEYRIPATAPSLRLQLIDLGSEKEPVIAKMDIPRNTTSGIVIFRCGLLLKPGKTVFRLITIEGESVLAQTKVIDVRWPGVTVHVPLMVETYSSNVTVHVELGSVRCLRDNERKYDIHLELIYEGPDGEGKSVWQDPSVIFSKELKDWLMSSSHDVNLRCEYFDRAGYYKVRIRDSALTVAESPTIRVIWSNRYSVQVTKASVEPCDESLKIIYHYPRCASDRDRLRVYGKMWSGLLKQPKYIFESRVRIGEYITKLSCDLFEDELQEYCFSFVSTAKNGAVYERDTQCIPRLAASDKRINKPTWNEWSAWSECSSTCGVGVHSRYRFCSSKNVNVRCDGKSVQTEICNIRECPESSSSPGVMYPELSSECLCGCYLNLTSNMLLRTTLTRCQHPVYWIVRALPDNRITFTILELFLPAVEDVLLLRDGITSLSPVLGIYSNSNRSEVLHTTSPTLRLEVYSANSSFGKAIVKILLSPSEILKESMAVFQSVPIKSENQFSTVHIAIISLMVVAFTATVFLIALLCIRRIKEMKESSDSPSLCSLSNEEQGNGSPVQQLLAASTSTSELSDSSLMHPQRVLKENAPTPSNSPEDYLQNCFLFRSLSSICATNSSFSDTPIPTPRRMHFNPNVETPQVPASSPLKCPEETGSHEFDASKKPLKSALKSRLTVAQNGSCSNTPSPVRRRGKLSVKGIKQPQRDSITPLTASVSELSVTGSEDGFEYDYYDYGCHDEPGSFFCPDPILVGWPPFIPIPPDLVEDGCDLTLHHLTYSPVQSKEDKSPEKSSVS